MNVTRKLKVFKNYNLLKFRKLLKEQRINVMSF